MRNADVRPALPEELAPAFALIFRRFPEEERAPRTLRALRLVSEGELLADGILVVPGETGLLGALVCVALPGASGLVWPPQTVGDAPCDAIEDVLLHHGLRWLRGRGVRLAQTLLLP